MPAKTRRFLAAVTILLTSTALFGQTFEVASIKATGTDCRGKISVDPQQIRYSNYSLKGLVRDAYRVELDQINAPAWFGDACYDIVARLPEGSGREQTPSMLKTLLEERFRLKAHSETRQERVYALVVAKNGPHLVESEVGSEQSQSVALRADGRIEFTSATLASFSSAMAVLIAHPVVNMTNIQGYFDITLNVTREDLVGVNLPSLDVRADNPENRASSSVFAAMQELGLKLESRNAPIEHIVVDSAEKIPTGN